MQILKKRRALMLTAVSLSRTGLLIAPATFAQAQTVNSPEVEQPPVVQLSETRGEIVLNGLWKFMPGQGPAAQAPTAQGWGLIPVPGSWGEGTWKGRLPRLLRAGTGEQWKDAEESTQGWYERNVVVPAEWRGRTVVLDIARVSTDAVVELNGVKCGQIAWPRGAVDVTQAVKFGERNTLRVRVLATTNADTVPNFMGTVDSQVSFAKATLDSRGITGDVVLFSRPSGAHISDVFVQTSTRKKQLAVSVELAAVPQDGTVQFEAQLLDERGKLEKTFTQAGVAVKAGASQTVAATWPWPNPRLWDTNQPNLYTLRLRVTGAGIADQWKQEFGFREIWTQGRDFYLNGTLLRLRPTSSMGTGGMEAIAESSIDSMRGAGFNFYELWPNDPWERGSFDTRAEILRAADRKGFLVAASLPGMAGFIIDFNTWRSIYDENQRQKYEARALADLRRFRNHPSAIMWSTSANFFGGPNDPKFIGTADYLTPDNRTFKPGQEGVASIKKHDPTRLVLTHHGGAVGDVYTNNMYLNLMPLQEREEWLSHYAKNGTMPFMPVEFGTPLSTTMMRGRNGFGNAVQTEPWVTEFSSIYFGTEAYRKEAPEYRQAIIDQFTEGQVYNKKGKGNWQNHPAIDSAPPFQMLQELFSTNTWRSWRTWGISGGIIPWSNGHGWSRGPKSDRKQQNVWTPGMRGAFYPETTLRELKPFSPPSMKVEPAGKALIANNNETLAWIAGPSGNFTDKTHSYPAGATVAKQVVLINDTRKPQKATYTWKAQVGGKAIAAKSLNTVVPAGKTLQLPIGFKVPSALPIPKAEGLISLTASIGGRRHSDNFAFRAFQVTLPKTGSVQKVPVQKNSVQVFDPKGRTSAMLKSLGYSVQPWNGKARSGVVVVGREALSGGGKLPGDLEAFVRGGGRAIIFNQNPAWIQDYLGWRTPPHVSRRVFPLPGAHPVTAGLDAKDLRDWAGTSDLVEAYPDASLARKGAHGGPYSGWRWGNRHMVSSAPIEKPHRSSWRPILETEFDLAYTPLMEFDYGKGRLIWCGLDLEEHTGLDPAAHRVARQLMQYAATSRLSPKAASVSYLGGEGGRKLLDSLGVIYTSTQTFDAKSSLILLGQDAGVSEETLRDYVQKGGRVVMLPGTGENALLSAKRIKKTNFAGSLDVPAWPEAAGLSASDLRYRAPLESWLIANGAAIEVGANGLLGRQRIGKGLVLWVQVDPQRFNAEENTYFRFTRWRSTRALSQVLSNMGASFKTDSLVFHPRSRSEGTVSLAGRWAAKWVQRIPDPSEQRHPDPGISNSAKAMMRVTQHDGNWDRLLVPGMWETAGGNWDKGNGEVIYRKTVELPVSASGKDMLLSLGRIDDRDETWFNGRKVGGSQGTESEHSVERKYMVPGALVKAGKNVIAIRVWDSFGGGGLGGPAQNLFLQPAQSDATENFYHADYISDFDMGDDPYRYYNW
jgi:beta-galactosidase